MQFLRLTCSSLRQDPCALVYTAQSALSESHIPSYTGRMHYLMAIDYREEKELNESLLGRNKEHLGRGINKLSHHILISGLIQRTVWPFFLERVQQTTYWPWSDGMNVWGWTSRWSVQTPMSPRTWGWLNPFIFVWYPWSLFCQSTLHPPITMLFICYFWSPCLK